MKHQLLHQSRFENEAIRRAPSLIGGGASAKWASARNLGLVLCTFLITLAATSRAGGQDLQLRTIVRDVPELCDDEWHSFEVDIDNPGPLDVTPREAIVACKSCTRVEVLPALIRSGRSASMTVAIRSTDRRGKLKFAVDVLGESAPICRVELRTLRRGLSVVPRDVYVGDVGPQSTTGRSFHVRAFGLGEVALSVVADDSSPFRVSIAGAPEHESRDAAEGTEREYVLTGEFTSGDRRPGVYLDQFKIIATPTSPGGHAAEATVTLRATVLSPLPAIPPLAYLGAIEDGQDSVCEVLIQRDDGLPLSISTSEPCIRAQLQDSGEPNADPVLIVRCNPSLLSEPLLDAYVELRDSNDRLRLRLPVIGVRVNATHAVSQGQAPTPLLPRRGQADLIRSRIGPIVNRFGVDISTIDDLAAAIVADSKASNAALTPLELFYLLSEARVAGVLPGGEVPKSGRMRIANAWQSTRAAGTLTVPTVITLMEARRSALASSRTDVSAVTQQDPAVWSAVFGQPDQPARMSESSTFSHADGFRRLERGQVVVGGEYRSVLTATDGLSRLIMPLPDGPAAIIPLDSLAAFEADDFALESFGGLCGSVSRGTAMAREHDLATFLSAVGEEAAFVEEGGEWIGENWTIRVRIGVPNSFIAWLAPALGFAPVRTEETIDVGKATIQFVREMSDFRCVQPGVFLPWRVVKYQQLVLADGEVGAEYFRRELFVKDYRANCFAGVALPELQSLVPAHVTLTDYRTQGEHQRRSSSGASNSEAR